MHSLLFYFILLHSSLQCVNSNWFYGLYLCVLVIFSVLVVWFLPVCHLNCCCCFCVCCHFTVFAFSRTFSMYDSNIFPFSIYRAYSHVQSHFFTCTWCTILCRTLTLYLLQYCIQFSLPLFTLSQFIACSVLLHYFGKLMWLTIRCCCIRTAPYTQSPMRVHYSHL